MKIALIINNDDEEIVNCLYQGPRGLHSVSLSQLEVFRTNGPMHRGVVTDN